MSSLIQIFSYAPQCALVGALLFALAGCTPHLIDVPETSSTGTTKTITSVSVTGLSNDANYTLSKTWTWGCSASSCTYRFAVDSTSNTDPSGAYGATTTTTQNTGSGTTYLHVQAKSSDGAESSVVHVSALLDHTAPADPTGVADGTSILNTSATPSVSWTASTDAHSGMDHYEVAVGTTAGNNDKQDWTAVGNVTSYSPTVCGNCYLSGSTYYTSVRAVDALGNTSAVVSGDGWTVSPFTQTSYLKRVGPAVDEKHGASVAVNGTGTTIVIGTPGTQSTGTVTIVTSGVVSALGDQATQGIGDDFGASVGISGDWIIVGAPGSDSNGFDAADNSRADSGAVYFFQKNGGGVWNQQDWRAPHPPNETFLVSTAGYDFGRSVAIDGTIAVVGAPGNNNDNVGVTNSSTAPALIGAGSANSGAAYVLENSGVTWPQTAFLKANNAEAGDKFGTSVAISGTTIVVGAPQEDATTAGDNDKLGWDAVGNVTSYSPSFLSNYYTTGTTYYTSVRAVDALGNTSAAVSGDGWVPAPFTQATYLKRVGPVAGGVEVDIGGA